MSKNVVIAGLVIVVLVVGGWFFTRPKSPTTSEVMEATPAPVESESASPSSPSAMMAEENMVAISADGFSPKDMTVKAGASVTWENTDSANHTVNSAPHPVHTLFPFLNLGPIKPGEKKSAVFEKAGEYTYHDHLYPSNTGTVTVE